MPNSVTNSDTLLNKDFQMSVLLFMEKHLQFGAICIKKCRAQGLSDSATLNSVEKYQ